MKTQTIYKIVTLTNQLEYFSGCYRISPPADDKEFRIWKR